MSEHQKPVTDDYRTGWERCFGEKPAGPRVLIVDDDPKLEELLRAAFKQGAEDYRFAANPTLTRPTKTEPCDRCDGCGKIADSEDGEAWTAWSNLPPGSDIAVRMGIVKPIPCPSCGGSGRAP